MHNKWNEGRNFWGVGMGRTRVIVGYQERHEIKIPISVDVAANNWRNSLSIPAIRQQLNWNWCVKLPVATCVSYVFLTFSIQGFHSKQRVSAKPFSPKVQSTFFSLGFNVCRVSQGMIILLHKENDVKIRVFSACWSANLHVKKLL